MTALVIVDLQHDFIQGSLAISEAKTIIPKITSILNHNWSCVIATRDWHPSNHTSFASNHNVSPFTEMNFKHPQSEETRSQTLWPVHCVQNTIGSQLDPEFTNAFNALSIAKVIVNKGYLSDREYYSCFQDCWGVHHTEMDQVLRENGVSDVVFVGLAYDFCVLNSALDCAALGYKTSVARDYCKSVWPEKNGEIDERYEALGVKILEGELSR